MLVTSLLGSSGLLWSGGCPIPQILGGEGVGRELRVEEGLEEVAEALVVFGIHVVVPLLEPRQVLLKDGEKRGQSLRGPAVLFHHFGVVCGHRLREFKRVPAGPAYEQGLVVVAAHARQAEEALLGDVERPAQAPVRRLQEVGGAVLGRRGEVAGLLLLSAPLLGLEASRMVFVRFVFASGRRGSYLGVDIVLAPL